jgi:hypothetical protein
MKPPRGKARTLAKTLAKSRNERASTRSKHSPATREHM